MLSMAIFMYYSVISVKIVDAFTIELKSTAKPASVKRQALHLYLEGLRFSSIGHILLLSHVSVRHWVRKYGREIDTIRHDHHVNIMELDELHTCIGHKKTTDRFGFALLEKRENTLISLLVTEQKGD